jgi:hypothetical protein
VRPYNDQLECFQEATHIVTFLRGRAQPPAILAMSSNIAMSSIPCAASRWRCSICLLLPGLPPPRVCPCIRRLARRTRREIRLPRHVGPQALARERACEAELAAASRAVCSDGGILPDLKALIERFRSKGMASPVVVVTLPSLAIYDEIAATVREAA